MPNIFHFDIELFIKTLGYTGLFLVVFVESGLLIGMFFPGDSLLFTAGLLAALGLLNIWVLIPVVILAAILGDSVGYLIGWKFGPKIFSRDNSLLFDKKYAQRTHEFYERHGSKAVILARFIPIIRTLIPTVAGIGKMEYRKFLRFNVVGGVLWSSLVPLIGFYLGKSIKNIDHYLLPITLGIIVVSFIPVFVEVWKGKRQSA